MTAGCYWTGAQGRPPPGQKGQQLKFERRPGCPLLFAADNRPSRFPDYRSTDRKAYPKSIGTFAEERVERTSPRLIENSNAAIRHGDHDSIGGTTRADHR